jgi:hypothetical protein
MLKSDCSSLKPKKKTQQQGEYAQAPIGQQSSFAFVSLQGLLEQELVVSWELSFFVGQMVFAQTNAGKNIADEIQRSKKKPRILILQEYAKTRPAQSL